MIKFSKKIEIKIVIYHILTNFYFGIKKQIIK